MWKKGGEVGIQTLTRRSQVVGSSGVNSRLGGWKKKERKSKKVLGKGPGRQNGHICDPDACGSLNSQPTRGGKPFRRRMVWPGNR